MCQREEINGKQEDEGQQRKSLDRTSGQDGQVKGMVIDVQFYSAFDKSPNTNLKNNGD